MVIYNPEIFFEVKEYLHIEKDREQLIEVLRVFSVLQSGTW